jgi:hypothetical protein
MRAWLQRQVWRLAYGALVYISVWALVGVVRLLASPGPLTLRVTPMVGFAPLAITLDVHVIPEPEDRTIWLTSDPYISGSDIQLDGAKSTRTHHRVWRVTEPGEYAVRAEVGHGQWSRASALVRINVQ